MKLLTYNFFIGFMLSAQLYCIGLIRIKEKPSQTVVKSFVV